MWEYNALVKRVVDGDTMDLRIDLGFTVAVDVRVRLYGINTPETYGVKKGSNEYRAGMRAKDFVEGWLNKFALMEGIHLTENAWWVRIRSHDGRKLGQGKYGRWIVEVWGTMGEEESCLNSELVEQGLAEEVTY